MKKDRISKKRMFLLTVATLFLLGCGSDGGENQRSAPAVVSTSADFKMINTGGALTVTTEVFSAEYAENVTISVYLKNEDKGAGCGDLDYLMGSDTIPYIAQPVSEDGAEPSASLFYNRLNKSVITWDPDTNNQTVTVERQLLVPEVPEGRYFLTAVIESDVGKCCLFEDTIEVYTPATAELVFSFNSLLNNSFSLPEYDPRPDKWRNTPVFSLSTEIYNSGLPASKNIDVGFELEIDGEFFPLLVSTEDDNGDVIPATRYTIAAVDEGISLEGADAVAATLDLYVGDGARAGLEALTADKTCYLHMTVDPDDQIPGQRKEDNIQIMPVAFLYGRSDCKPDSSDYPQVFSCYKPGQNRASNESQNDYMRSYYTYAESAANPSYFAFGPGEVPQIAAGYSYCNMQVGKGEGKKDILNTEFSTRYQLPPESSVEDAGRYSARWKAFDYTIFDKDDVSIALGGSTGLVSVAVGLYIPTFSQTFGIGPIPLDITAGADAQVGVKVSGSVHISGTSDDLKYKSYEFFLGIGPYALAGGYGQVSAGIPNFLEGGVGIDLNLLDVSLVDGPCVTYEPPSEEGASAGWLAELKPELTAQMLSGEFYAFLKTMGIELARLTFYKASVRSYVSYLDEPKQAFLGPIGEFRTAGGKRVGTIDASVLPNIKGSWSGRIALNKGTYVFRLNKMNSVEVGCVELGSDHCFKTENCTDNETIETWKVPEDGYYTVNAYSLNCGSSSAGRSYLYWTEAGDSAVGGYSKKAITPDTTGACAISTWFYNTKWEGVPALYQCSQDVDFNLPYNQALKDAGVKIHKPSEGLYILWRGKVPVNIEDLHKVTNGKSNLVFFFDGNKKDPDYCNGIEDHLEMSLQNQNGYPFKASERYHLGEEGKAVAQIPIPKSVTEVWFTLKYNSAWQCENDPDFVPNDANIRMVVAPDTNWALNHMSYKPSTGEYANAYQVIDGPENPQKGTLSGGSVNYTMDHGGRSIVPWDLMATGAYYFPDKATYDFMAGATGSASFEVLVDGTPVMSRSVIDGREPLQNPDKVVGGPVRERHQEVEIDKGWHLLEAYYVNYAGMAEKSCTGLVNRLRWSPKNANEALAYFFLNRDELTSFMDNTDPEVPAYQPVLIYKDHADGALEYSWQTRSDCTEAFNDQVDCKDSFTSAHDLNYYSMLWDGNYDLSNEKAYPFHMRNSVSISSSDDGIAFWLDDQAYFEYWLGPENPPTVRYYPGWWRAYYTVLTSKKAGDVLNNIRLAWYGDPDAPEPPQLTAEWTEQDINTFHVVFMDAHGNLLYADSGTYDPVKQTLSIGDGTEFPLPKGTCNAIILLSPEGDPEGRYWTDTGYPGIDMTVSIKNHKASKNLADICINSWCTKDQDTYSLIAKKIKSTDFVPYEKGPSKEEWLGLFSKQRNAVYIKLHSSGGKGLDWQCLWHDPQSYETKWEISFDYSKHK